MPKLLSLIVLAFMPNTSAWLSRAVLPGTAVTRGRCDECICLQAAASIELPWYREAGNELRFGCTECGRCCTIEGSVIANAMEVEGLAEALDISVADFTTKHVEKSNGEWVTLKAKQGERGAEPCTLLGEDGLCTAYEARPLQCRTYPFWDVFMKSREAWEKEAVLADLIELDARRKGQRHWDPVDGGCEGLNAPDAPTADPEFAEAEAVRQRAWDEELETSLKRKPLTGGNAAPRYSDTLPGLAL